MESMQGPPPSAAHVFCRSKKGAGLFSPAPGYAEAEVAL